jgi:hypothetical protein
VTIQKTVVELAAEAIRVCGGRAMLKRYPLERYLRDATASALMRPWTRDIATQQAWEAELGLAPAGATAPPVAGRPGDADDHVKRAIDPATAPSSVAQRG